ncbi:hypothetical protein [Acinetobacter haemolyticus]|uniref:hypothetical protein n=1 Tax=Acinetobacter haemolyticus TaxID=29430 RepID=UPI000373F60F|nr:hypothetical protein [Acinetobacter haemolyticus]
MKEDQVDVNIRNYIGYIKLYKEVCVPKEAKINKSDIIDSQSGIERRLFSGYISFEKYGFENMFYMRSFLLTLTADIPDKEYIHALIKIFFFDKNQFYLIDKKVFDVSENGIIYNGLKQAVGEFYLYQEVDDKIFTDGRESKYIKYIKDVI